MCKYLKKSNFFFKKKKMLFFLKPTKKTVWRLRSKGARGNYIL